MAEVTLDAAPQKARDLFNKGLGAYERGRMDHAIDMLTHALEIEPRLLEARKVMRVAEVKRFNAECTGSAARMKSVVLALPKYLTARILLARGKGAEAVQAADALLRMNPIEKRHMFLFAEAAELAGMPEAAVQMLEIGQSQYPDDPDVLLHLGKGFQAAGDTKKATACFEKLCEVRPNDPAATKLLKDAMALQSMGTEGWGQVAGDKGAYRGLIKDQDEAKILEQQAKAVKTDQDLSDLIKDALAKIEAEPGNINYYRALARYYTQSRAFDDAVATLKKAMGLAPGDAEIENSVADVTIQKFDSEVAALRDSGRDQDAKAKEIERDQFLFDDLQDRVARYPNDLVLRYRLGGILFENDYINEAIQQFQLAQRNPQHRAKSLYYLGLCFRQKKQYDMAIEQLEAAAADLVKMDGAKKDVLYALGEISEETGDRQKAAHYFKQIYQVDIRYRDIAEKIEKAYAK